jgi:hypothetical protein
LAVVSGRRVGVRCGLWWGLGVGALAALVEHCGGSERIVSPVDTGTDPGFGYYSCRSGDQVMQRLFIIIANDAEQDGVVQGE